MPALPAAETASAARRAGAWGVVVGQHEEAEEAKEKEEGEVKKAKEEDKGMDKAPEEANGDIKSGDK